MVPDNVLLIDGLEIRFLASISPQVSSRTLPALSHSGYQNFHHCSLSMNLTPHSNSSINETKLIYLQCYLKREIGMTLDEQFDSINGFSSLLVAVKIKVYDSVHSS